MQREIDKVLSQRFANLSFAGMIMVVFEHTWPPLASAPEWCRFAYSHANLVFPMLGFFFLAAGYFLGGHVDESGWYKRALAARFRSLVIPAVIWSLLWTVYRSFNNGGWPWLRAAGLDPMHHPHMGILWFVRALLVMVALSPALVWVLRRWTRPTLLALILTLLYRIPGGRGTPEYFFYNFLGLQWMIFFAAGLAWRMGKIELKLSPQNALMVLTIGYLAYFVPGTFTRGLGLMLIPWALVSCFPAWKWPRALTGCAFAIFFLHWFISDVYGRYWYWQSESPAYWLLRFVTLAGGSLLLALLLRKFLPRVSVLLFGGR